MSPELRITSIVPWGSQAALRALRSTVLCAAALVLAWYQVAGQGVFNDQVSWLSLAVLAVMAEMAVLSGFIFRGRRAIGERRSALLTDDIAALFGAPAGPAVDAGAVSGTQVVTVAGSMLFHDSRCPMLAGRDVQELPASAAARARLEPCGICQGGLPS